MSRSESSVGDNIIYSNEFTGKSSADLRPGAARGANQPIESKEDRILPETDILKTRVSRVRTLDLLGGRSAALETQRQAEPIRNIRNKIQTFLRKRFRGLKINQRLS